MKTIYICSVFILMQNMWAIRIFGNFEYKKRICNRQVPNTSIKLELLFWQFLFLAMHIAQHMRITYRVNVQDFCVKELHDATL